MIAELLKQDIECLSTSDSVNDATDFLSREEATEIILADEGRYLYMLRELDIMSCMDDNTSLGLVAGDREGYFVYQEDHILKAFQKTQDNDLSILPVVNREMKYLGALKKEDILDYLSDSYSITDKESVIIIEHLARDFSLTTICSVIEQEGGKILGVLTAPADDQPERIWISITIHTNTLQQIISSLERHEFEIVAHMSNEENETIIKERYESLMTFLNV